MQAISHPKINTSSTNFFLSPMQSPVKYVESSPMIGMSDDTTECSRINSSVCISEDKASFWKKYITIKPKVVHEPNIFIVKRIEDDESTELAVKIMDILSAYKSKVFVEECTLAEMNEKKTSTQENAFHAFDAKEETNIDLLITIGGDGTILWALQYFNGATVPPILAYSKGTRNYLCNFYKDGYESSLRKVMDDISNGKPIQIEQRDRLMCEIKNNETGEKKVYHALNEVAITRGGVAGLAKVECYLEDKYLADFEGDGVMIATPTGSTAYQLSAGGPVVNHLGNSMTITPLAPLNLTTRPVVLPGHLQLAFKMNKDSRKNIYVNVDGQVSFEINKQTEVLVTSAPSPLSFLMNEESDTLDNWIFRLRNLVGWNKNSSSQYVL